MLLRGFPVVDGLLGLAVQTHGNWIEILSKSTNQTITLLNHIVFIGQVNQVCWVVVSLFGYIYKETASLNQG